MESLLSLDVATLQEMNKWDQAWTGVKGLAPEPLQNIPGYGLGTITQLAMYVNLRQWEICNDHAVAIANSISRTTDLLRAMGRVLEQISRGDVTEYSPAGVGDFVGYHSPVNPTIMEFLVGECGMEESQVFGAFSSESSRNDLMDDYQLRIRQRMSDNEHLQADLEVALGRADTYFGISINLIKQIGKSQQTSAMGLKR